MDIENREYMKYFIIFYDNKLNIIFYIYNFDRYSKY